MNKKIIMVILSTLPLYLTSANADTLKTAMELLNKSAPVLKVGQFIQDERGCIYNVIKKGNEITLMASVTTPKGDIICEYKEVKKLNKN